MKTLEEAWEWYAGRGRYEVTHPTCSAHWGRMPDRGNNEWVDQLLGDHVLRHLEPGEIVREAKAADDSLADLAVLVLFSVFEASSGVLSTIKSRARSTDSSIRV